MIFGASSAKGKIMRLSGATRLAVFGLIAFAFCVAAAVYFKPSDPEISDGACKVFLKTETDRIASVSDASLDDAVRRAIAADVANDEKGIFRIASVNPGEVELGGHLCVVVAGIVPLERETQAALDVRKAEAILKSKQQARDAATGEAARTNADIEVIKAEAAVNQARQKAAEPLAPIELLVFFNGVASPLKIMAAATHSPQRLWFALTSPEDAKDDGAQFWRDAVRGVGLDFANWGKREVEVGLSAAAGAATIPQVSGGSFTLYIYSLWPVLLGLLSMALLGLSFVAFARGSALLRDNEMTLRDLDDMVVARRGDRDRRKREFDAAEDAFRQAPADAARETARDAAKSALDAADRELARVTGGRDLFATQQSSTKRGKPTAREDLHVGSYSLGRSQMAFWLFLVVAGYVYVAMSIHQFFGLLNPQILILLGISGVTGLAAVSAAPAAAQGQWSRGPLRDILSSNGSPQLQRVQSVAWTAILAGIFVWVVVRDYRFPVFDETLLLLMGIVNSLYIGFKFTEGDKGGKGAGEKP